MPDVPEWLMASRTRKESHTPAASEAVDPNATYDRDMLLVLQTAMQLPPARRLPTGRPVPLAELEAQPKFPIWGAMTTQNLTAEGVVAADAGGRGRGADKSAKGRGRGRGSSGRPEEEDGELQQGASNAPGSPWRKASASPVPAEQPFGSPASERLAAESSPTLAPAPAPAETSVASAGSGARNPMSSFLQRVLKKSMDADGAAPADSPPSATSPVPSPSSPSRTLGVPESLLTETPPIPDMPSLGLPAPTGPMSRPPPPSAPPPPLGFPAGASFESPTKEPPKAFGLPPSPAAPAQMPMSPAGMPLSPAGMPPSPAPQHAPSFRAPESAGPSPLMVPQQAPGGSPLLSPQRTSLNLASALTSAAEGPADSPPPGPIGGLSTTPAPQENLLRQADEDQQLFLHSKCWSYKDPQGNVQGPFSTLQMRHWDTAGYFQQDLLVRFKESGTFYQLCTLYPQPTVPFAALPAMLAEPQVPLNSDLERARAARAAQEAQAAQAAQAARAAQAAQAAQAAHAARAAQAAQAAQTAQLQAAQIHAVHAAHAAEAARQAAAARHLYSADPTAAYALHMKAQAAHDNARYHAAALQQAQAVAATQAQAAAASRAQAAAASQAQAHAAATQAQATAASQAQERAASSASASYAVKSLLGLTGTPPGAGDELGSTPWVPGQELHAAASAQPEHQHMHAASHKAEPQAAPQSSEDRSTKKNERGKKKQDHSAAYQPQHPLPVGTQDGSHHSKGHHEGKGKGKSEKSALHQHAASEVAGGWNSHAYATGPSVNIQSSEDFPTLGGSATEKVVMEAPQEQSTGFWERPMRPVKIAKDEDAKAPTPAAAAAVGKQAPKSKEDTGNDAEKKQPDDGKDKAPKGRKKVKGKEVDPSLLGFTAPPRGK
eukprot:TRINITY_DN5718_c0_g4_i1.p1 TRINITY_DN5718_c0_g4~~TRINITY_DN5718_c0_g4_i1.p1  ORF type:complete len:889 (+),score=197.54 TRINITY_DN5718_c0_g4_i1:82-2748(+)